MRDGRAHYIRSNETARIPSRFIILDTEALRERDSKGETQSWALAVAEFITWTKRGTIQRRLCRYETALGLWSAVSDFTRPGRRTVLYAHNLNYDLRISQALSTLPEYGWMLTDMRLDGRGSWSKWHRDKASLNLCDSASIFPCKLEYLGNILRMPKLPLPNGDDREALFKRCERDVEILSDAIIRYISWMRTGQLGNWQMTGASQSWSHWRHSHYTHKVLVHDDSAALEAERAAMHTGRCEAWKWGSHTKGIWHEYDWSNSYPRIARDCELPARLCGTLADPNAESLPKLIDRYAVLADVTVTTDLPCVPASHDGRVLWPVGTFRTTLWDPELKLLLGNGADIKVHKAWLYRKAPILKDWSEWILSSLHDKTDTIEPWQKLILKHWSRALVGRFGMRYRSWEKYATAADTRVYMSILYDSDGSSLSDLMQIGRDVFVSGSLKEISDGCPQITGYIMSEARAKLWRVCQQIGPTFVLYMDTDSLIVDSSGRATILRLSGTPLFDGLRFKAKYRNVTIYGPRSLICDRRPTVAGMPKGSVQRELSKWEGDVWRGATESIRRGESNSVRISSTRFRLRYSNHRRYLNGNGDTLPYRLPEYTPSGKVIHRPSRLEAALANGYPSLLAYSQTAQYNGRPKRDRVSTSGAMRPMSEALSDIGQGV